MISERVKAALARARGKCGMRHPMKRSRAFRHRLQVLSNVAKRKAAMKRAEAYRMHIEWALRQPLLREGWPRTVNAAAKKLNERGIASPMGGSWCGISVRNMATRLGLSSPPPCRVSREVLSASARRILKEHPDCTTHQLMVAVRHEHPVGTSRALEALRRLRRSVARRSTAQKRLQWPLDRRLATRVRIAAIWKRHRDNTAKKVTCALGPVGHPVTVPWVQHILKRCWVISAKHTAKQLRAGRRRYIPKIHSARSVPIRVGALGCIAASRHLRSN